MTSQATDFMTAKKAKIENALQVLDETAGEAKDELKQLVKDKYSNLKSAFSQVVNKDDITHAVDESKAMIRRTARQVDGSIHDNPWMYIGAAGLFGLTIGYIFGRK